MKKGYDNAERKIRRGFDLFKVREKSNYREEAGSET